MSGSSLTWHVKAICGWKGSEAGFHSLFLLIMDPLLTRLQNSGLGLSINNFYAGGFIHADDIRTLSSSTESLEKHFSIVEIFSKENLLKLNVQDCEIVHFSLAIYSLSSSQVCEITHIDKNSCTMPWVSRPALEPLS